MRATSVQIELVNAMTIRFTFGHRQEFNRP